MITHDAMCEGSIMLAVIRVIQVLTIMAALQCASPTAIHPAEQGSFAGCVHGEGWNPPISPTNP
jgi:hypothetical protein